MIVGVSYTAVSVRDMDKAIAYFRDIIGMEMKSDTRMEGESVDSIYCLKGVKARKVVMRLPGGSDLQLVQHFAHKGRPVASTLRQYDVSFIHLDFANKGIEEIYENFQKKGVKTHCSIQLGPVQDLVQLEQTGGFKSFSFDGPDGLRLETHEFLGEHSKWPWGRWLPEVGPRKGFYGFVHTALSVGNLDRTLHLYRDILGLKIIQESHLEGDRFNKMDSLEGGIAENRIVRADQGSDIQFIWHYAGAHKGKGKPVGATSQQCDIGIVNIGLRTDDIEGLHHRLKEEGVTINCGIQVNPDNSRAFSFRDPDGNLLVVHD